MSTPAIPDLDQRGFVKVACASCGRDDVWLRCDGCQKSDHFLFDGQVATCACGATYDHATCLCGETVPADRLAFTPFDQGPMALADLEWDPTRIVILAGIALLLVGGAAWLFLG
ncbi:MAG: hypothetical protein H6739_09265 [Alphaproteobacteria bacterium]|nr:hypothetical protein [Alphaproteobacteria bacterium]